MSHVFDKYFQRHGHYPRIRLDNGSQRLQVMFTPSYVSVTTYPRGATIYIQRSTLVKLLRHPGLIPLVRKMKGDWDVPAAVAASIEHEREFREEKRQIKKTSSESQRQRYLRAKARSAKRRGESS